MYRSVVYLGLFVTVMCGIGLIGSQSTSYMTVLLPYGIISFINLLIALVLIYFATFSFKINNKIKRLFVVGSLILGAMFVVGLLFPTYFGLIYMNENPINLVMMAINSVGLMIASLEKPRENNLVRSFSDLKNQKMHSLLNLTHKIHLP